MAKRFTDTDIWKNQRWFRKLSPINKLIFCYIKDSCNHAGVWKVDCSDLVDDLGIDDFDLDFFIESVNTEYDKVKGIKMKKERLILIDNLLWLSGFIQFQYEGKDRKVNPEASPVRTALHYIEGIHKECETLTKPLRDPQTLLNYALHKKHIRLTHPLRETWERPKEKDKDKDSINSEFTNSLKGEGENLKNEKQFSNFRSQGERTVIEGLGGKSRILGTRN